MQEYARAVALDAVAIIDHQAPDKVRLATEDTHYGHKLP
jgi:hypothetical protein